MASEFRTIARHTAVYGAGIVAAKVVSLVMLPLYTHYLSPSNFGVLELLETTVDVIGMLAGMGLAASAFRHYPELKTEDERRQFVSSLLIGSAAVALLVALLGVALSGFLTRLVFSDTADPLYFRVFFATFFFQSFSNIGLAVVRVEERSLLYVALTVARLIVTVALNIWFVVGLHAGVLGVLGGNAIGSALLAILLAVYAVRRFGLHYSHPIFRKLSRFGAPLGISSLGSFVLAYSDRYFLNHYHGSAPVGIYSLGYSFAFLLSSFAVVPFGQIWEPRRFVIAKQPDAQQVYRHMFFYLNSALFGGSIALVLFTKDGLSVLVGPAFVTAYRVVPLLLVTTIVQQWTTYCNFGLYLKNATHVLAWTGTVAALVALGCNWLLIPQYGMMGAAWATLIAYVVRFIPTYTLAQRQYHVHYPWGKVSVLASMLALALIVRAFANALPFAVSLTISSALLVVIGAVLFGVLLDRSERNYLLGFVRSRMMFAQRQT
ncbi:polysaccharide biosynthesis C-terminal domain-containing protein [soil metagenome]